MKLTDSERKVRKRERETTEDMKRVSLLSMLSSSKQSTLTRNTSLRLHFDTITALIIMFIIFFRFLIYYYHILEKENVQK